MKKIVLIIITVLILALFFIFIKGSSFGPKNQRSPIYQIDYSKEYPSVAANIAGFEKKKTGSNFVAYFHPEDEVNANKSLAVLEQAGLPMFKKYLGYEPNDINVYLTTSVDEYVKIAEFPGGRENVKIGDGSAPNGKIYLYKPFDDTTGKAEGMIVHEGVHVAIFQLLGQDKMRFLPGFLNEGLAHYIEYVFKAGPNFDPLEQIYHSDLLINGVKNGDPKLLSIAELGQRCDNYIFDETLNFLCRGQGTYVVWYVQKNYGEGIWGQFLINLKQNQDWQLSLSDLTKKTITDLGKDILDQLESSIK